VVSRRPVSDPGPVSQSSPVKSSLVQSGQSSQQSVSYPTTDPTAPELLAAESVSSTPEHSPEQQATVAVAAALSVTTLVQSVELRLNVLLGFPGYPGGTQLTSLLVELLQAEQQFVDSPVLVGQFLAATADLRASLTNHLQNHPAMTPGVGGGDLFHLPRPTLGLDQDRSASYLGGAGGGMPAPKVHRPDQQAALTEALALAQSVEQGMLMLRCLPGSPQGSHWTFLLIELVRAEEQLVDYGFPELVGQFLAETAGLRSWLARHIRNHPAMAPGGGSVDLFQMPLPTVVLYRGGSSSSQGEDSTNPGRGRLGDDERARRMDQNLCLACGKSGHWKDDCPNMSKGKKGKKGPSRSR
jgi:hypothetical protein